MKIKELIQNTFCNTTIYFYQGKYPEALENQFKSLKIREEIVDKSGIVDIKKGLAKTYLALKNYTLAL